MLIQRAFLPTMADDMLGVAQQILGPLRWYSKSKTEKKTYSQIRNMSVLDLCSHSQCFYDNFSFIFTAACPKGHLCAIGEVCHYYVSDV